MGEIIHNDERHEHFDESVRPGCVRSYVDWNPTNS
jgi:hypothetical protein